MFKLFCKYSGGMPLIIILDTAITSNQCILLRTDLLIPFFPAKTFRSWLNYLKSSFCAGFSQRMFNLPFF